jgi:peptide/nickel transport system substrate-binding protein
MPVSKLDRLMQRPISRRQFLRYSAYSAAGVYIGVHGLSFAQGTEGGTLVWLGHQEVAGLGPNDIGADVQAAVIFNILNPLVHVDSMAETVPVLARSYEVGDDNLSYTFHLHEGVRFHDGSELTAEDVKYTFDTYSQPGNTVASRFNGMRDVDVIDRYTVRVNMESVNASFLRSACEVPIVPMAYHQSVGVDGFRTAPIGTGAFRVSEWRPAEYTELVAFPDHFRGAPKVDRIRLEVVPEASVRYIALLTGDADASVWPIAVEDALELEGDPNFQVIRTNWNSPRFIPLNTQRPQLSDRRVRQAMMFALDRQRILDDLESGLGVVATSHLAPHNPYYNPNVAEYPYDPERARSVLELSQLFLRAVGIEMQLAEAPVASILQGLREGTLDAALFNWTMGSTVDPSPTSVLYSNGGDNFMRYQSEEMDRLIDEGLSVVDPALRRPIYDRTQELFADDMPALVLHFKQDLGVFSRTMVGVPDEVLMATPIWFDGHKYSRR